MTIICHYCGDPFEGRPNRVYCSTSCKSAINNQRYAARDLEARKIERYVRANRNVLSKLYGLFGDTPLPLSLILRAKLDTRFYSGSTKEASRFNFLDFSLQMDVNKNYQIIKSSINE